MGFVGVGNGFGAKNRVWGCQRMGDRIARGQNEAETYDTGKDSGAAYEYPTQTQINDSILASMFGRSKTSFHCGIKMGGRVA